MNLKKHCVKKYVYSNCSLYEVSSDINLKGEFIGEKKKREKYSTLLVETPISKPCP